MDWRTGIIVTLDIQKDSITHKFDVIEFEESNGLNVCSNYNAVSNKIKKYSEIIKDSNLLLRRWNELCVKRSNDMTTYIFLPKLMRWGVNKLGLLKFINSKVSLFRLTNYIRCETHRDMLLNIIDKELNKGEK